MIDNITYNNLLECLKKIESEYINYPIQGTQKKIKIKSIDDIHDFELIINRKGHINTNNLTYLFNSIQHKCMVRLDYNGAEHDNFIIDVQGNQTIVTIATPHLHIYNEDYNNGKIAIPLSDLVDNTEFIEELYDSLVWFLDYHNVQRNNIVIRNINLV